MNSAGLTAIFKKQPIGFSGAVLGLVLAGLLYVRSDQIAENQAIADAKAAEAAQMLSNTRHAEGLTKQVDQMQAFGKEVENRLVRSGQLGINLQYFYYYNQWFWLQVFEMAVFAYSEKQISVRPYTYPN